MIKKLLQILFVFLTYLLLLILQKPLFTLAVGGYSSADTWAVMYHGAPMDISLAAYFTIIPLLLTIAKIWVGSKNKKSTTLNIITFSYFAFTGLCMAAACVVNAGLYPVWRFPLDATPIFYVTSSPVAAMASESYWVWAIGLLIIIVLACLYTWACIFMYFKLPKLIVGNKDAAISRPRKWAQSAVLLLIGCALVIPIRGGMTVSTMNVSRVYFSDESRLNHAAVNPLFNLMYSILHQHNFKHEFRFFDDDKAQGIFQGIIADKTYADSLPSTPQHIQLIVLESFSSHLMPSLGGDSIAMRLDSIAAEGYLFTNFYSSSFRTDRALPAILNGYPAQPTTSLIKFVNMFDKLPAIPRCLEQHGFSTCYYYGGDINYCNISGLLIAGGFDDIISDADFPVKQKLSKWGAHDDVLLQRVWQDMKDLTPEDKTFSVIQTSSSHEPFEVPYQGRSGNLRINAFEFTDSCLGAYVDSLKNLPEYDNTLLIILPDHFGVYPDTLTDHRERHRIPLVLAGGFANRLDIRPELLDRIGSQTDLAATILAIAGISHDKFIFSNNLLDPARQPIAFFSEPSWIGAISPAGMAEITVETSSPQTAAPDSLYDSLKAYYQVLYDDLNLRYTTGSGIDYPRKAKPMVSLNKP